MASKRKTKRYRKGETPTPWLSPEATRDLIGFGLAFFALFLLLASVNLAGSLGAPVTGYGLTLIGYSTYVLPILLLLYALGLLWPERFSFKINFIWGSLLLLVTMASLFALVIPQNLSDAGGIIGQTINNVGLVVLSPVMLGIFLLLLLAASLVVMSDRSISWLIERFTPQRKTKVKDDEPIIVNQQKLPVRPLFNFRSKPAAAAAEPAAAPAPQMPRDLNWQPYPLDLLEPAAPAAQPANIKENREIIERTLANFGINVEMGDVSVGPTVTQFSFKPDEGVKLNQITGLSNDLALALAAHPIRIEAPIPGKSLVGIEVPNRVKSLVRLRELLEETGKSKSGRLTIPLGRAVAGDAVELNITSLPHLLIAGQTNAGKSVGINSILLSLLYKNSPRDLRLILIDPKRVELVAYNAVPHLLSPIIVEPEPAISALKWAIIEMERRFKQFADAKKRNLDEYNISNKDSYLPHVVIVIDELATLMQTASNEVEAAIIRLAQMSRATGIHLILATQRPESNVITGLIKANIPARVAFAVASQVDSRIILDAPGADKLLGKGDLLYATAEMAQPRRVQGIYVSEKEIVGVTDYLKQSGETNYESAVTTQPVKLGGGRGASIMSTDELNSMDDELFDQAATEVIRQGKASASLLQRRLRVGYARAARLLDILEERGVIGPGEGARPREVLISDLAEIGAGDDLAEPTEQA